MLKQKQKKLSLMSLFSIRLVSPIKIVFLLLSFFFVFLQKKLIERRTEEEEEVKRDLSREYSPFLVSLFSSLLFFAPV